MKPAGVSRSLVRAGLSLVVRLFLFAGFLSVFASGLVSGQVVGMDGYALNVGTFAGESAGVEAQFGDFQRLRLGLTAASGPLRFEAAYEHTFLLREAAEQTGSTGLVQPSAVGNWWDLEWQVRDDKHLRWAHRFDRLSATVAIDEDAEVVLGRQVISWASTLVLTPSDPFTPFDPSDPFREYRAGVDAARLRVYLGPFSDLDVVVRPTTGPDDRITVLARLKTTAVGWDLSAWGGALFDEAAGAVAAVGSWGPWAVRGEASLRDDARGTAFRGAVGVDRRTSWWGKDVYLVAEYRRDDFGATDGAIEEVVTTPAFARGELQMLSRDASALQWSIQLHPLVGVDALVLLSLNDGSGLLGPGLSWSSAENSSLRLGAFVSWGAEEAGRLPSEFGAVPVVLYLSFSQFF